MSSGRTFVIGTRGSRLALTQTGIVQDTLQRIHPEASFGLRTVRTEGDRSAASLSEIGGRGVFVIELERALLEGKIDVAVHSLKDLPSEETAGLTIGAVLERGDPRDAFVSKVGGRLQGLPPGATVGTGSPRRAAQIAALRPDLRLADIRGNVDTRLRKVAEGEFDAVVLAAAGLTRLGWIDRASQLFEPDELLPAVGQGALAVQVRSDDADAVSLVQVADDLSTRFAVTAERAFERRLGGGCHAAIAAYGVILSEAKPVLSPVEGNLAQPVNEAGRNESASALAVSTSEPVAQGSSPEGPAPVGHDPSLDAGPDLTLHLRGLVGASDGKLIRGEVSGPAADAERLGVELAERLLEQGAGELLEATTEPGGTPTW